MDKQQQMFESWAVDNGYDDLTKYDRGVYTNNSTEDAYYGFLGALSVVRNFVTGF